MTDRNIADTAPSRQARRLRALTIAAASFLTAVALTAPPAHANQTVIDFTGTGSPTFAESVSIMRSAAHRQPSFKTTVVCDQKRQCATVEFALRPDNPDGAAGGADFFIYPDADPSHVHWCFVDPRHKQVRFCTKAGERPHTEVTWFEAAFPKAGEYREIEYGEGHIDPECARFQTSQYDIDGAYVDCIVNRDDAYPPPPTGGNRSERGSGAPPPPPVVGGSAESRYLTIVFRMIKAHLHATPGLHLDLANQHGLVDFYVNAGGNLIGSKLVSSSGSPNLDTAVMAAIAEAAPYPAPPRSPIYLSYNFGRSPRPVGGH